jgi:hypothetical protein
VSNLAARPPQPSDFEIMYDMDHFFEFFEDENGEALWAHGSLSSEEFVEQVNEYDRICGSDWEGYTEDDVKTLWAVALELPDPYIQPVDEGTDNAGLIKRIRR